MTSAKRLSIILLFAVAFGCGGSGKPQPSTAPVPDSHPLAGLAAVGAIVTPTYALRVAPGLDWTARLEPSRETLRAMDGAIAAAIASRGLRTGWLFPADLALTYKRNPSYASDPYALASETLRSPSFIAGSRLTEPLASQLRTMIALHENARFVLMPIELRFERADSATNTARATLKLATIDPRFSEARWVGEIRSDTASADPHALMASLARGVADLIVSR